MRAVASGDESSSPDWHPAAVGIYYDTPPVGRTALPDASLFPRTEKPTSDPRRDRLRNRRFGDNPGSRNRATDISRSRMGPTDPGCSDRHRLSGGADAGLGFRSYEPRH